MSDVGDLFKDFSQVGNVYSKKMSGTGLGLSISKKIVQMMGGQIGVKSRSGKGSCFSFDIHLSLPSSMPISKEQQKSNKITQFSGRILLVDDDPVGLIYGEKLLTKVGMGIDTAENGTAALQACRDNYYDVIFLDIQMPDIDGYQVADAIRLMEQKSGFRSVIIALTAYSLQDEAEQCRQHGIDDLLDKPMRLDEVMEKINFWKT
jgi:CheY-like chemotaxis protein